MCRCVVLFLRSWFMVSVGFLICCGCVFGDCFLLLVRSGSTASVVLGALSFGASSREEHYLLVSGCWLLGLTDGLVY